MRDTLIWTGQSGKQEPISEMHENHLMNAYAKTVREKDNRAERPALAAEIAARGLNDRLPPYAIAALPADLPQTEVFPY